MSGPREPRRSQRAEQLAAAIARLQLHHAWLIARADERAELQAKREIWAHAQLIEDKIADLKWHLRRPLRRANRTKRALFIERSLPMPKEDPKPPKPARPDQLVELAERVVNAGKVLQAPPAGSTGSPLTWKEAVDAAIALVGRKD